MKRPSFQFYPGDWQSNSNLKRCTRLEKSVWLDVLCLMHDQEEYGVLRWTLKEIAEAAHCKISELKSLHEKGVLKGSDKGQICASYVYVPRSGRRDGDPVELLPKQQGPIWYSSRFVRDEYVRTIRGESSRFGDSPDDSPKPPKGERTKASPKPPFGDGASSSSSSSSSASPTGKKQSATSVALDLPDWIPEDAWLAFVAMRKKIRAPLTDDAVKLAISTLEKLMQDGHRPRAVLDQSTLNSWRGLFEVKGTQQRANGHQLDRQAFNDRENAKAKELLFGPEANRAA